MNEDNQFCMSQQVIFNMFPERTFLVQHVRFGTRGKELSLLGNHEADGEPAKDSVHWVMASACLPVSESKEECSDPVNGPPHGLKLRRQCDLDRFFDITQAIKRFIHASKQIRPEWITEYNEIVARLAAAGDKLY